MLSKKRFKGYLLVAGVMKPLQVKDCLAWELKVLKFYKGCERSAKWFQSILQLRREILQSTASLFDDFIEANNSYIPNNSTYYRSKN